MVKIVCISDTHNQHKQVEIPECDILIHAGDFTGRGTEHEIQDFAQWLLYESKNFKYKRY